MSPLFLEENKRNRVVDSEATLELLRCNSDKFRCSEEGEDGEIDSKVMSTVFCDARGIIYTDYLKKRTKDNWSVLYVFFAPVGRRNQEKMSSFEKDPLSSRQCTGAHLRSFDVQNYGIKI